VAAGAGPHRYDAGLQTVTGFYVLDSILTGNMAALKAASGT
jgi:hypothetical protein